MNPLSGWNQKCTEPCHQPKSSVAEFWFGTEKVFISSIQKVHLWLSLSEGTKHNNLHNPVTNYLAGREHFLFDLGLWAAPNHDCFQMWKFDFRLVPVVCLTNQLHTSLFWVTKHKRSPGKTEYMSSRATPQHATYGIYQLLILKASGFTSLVWISSPIKCDNNRTHESVVRIKEDKVGKIFTSVPESCYAIKYLLCLLISTLHAGH